MRTIELRNHHFHFSHPTGPADSTSLKRGLTLAEDAALRAYLMNVAMTQNRSVEFQRPGFHHREHPGAGSEFLRHSQPPGSGDAYSIRRSASRFYLHNVRQGYTGRR